MSVIATAVRHLMAAGVTGEALVAAIADMEAATPKDEVAEKRRAYDRERKRKAKIAGSTGIPPESVESAGSAPLSLPPNDINSNPPAHTPAMAAPARKGFPVPEGVTAEQWQAFTAQRKKKLNDRAYGLLCGKLADLARAGWPPGEMIDRATEHGWETVFPPKETRNVRPANDRPNEIDSPYLRRGLARAASRRPGPDFEREGLAPMRP